MTTDREALAELVACKDLIDSIPDSWQVTQIDAHEELGPRYREYNRRKPLAWAAARARLALPEAVPARPEFIVSALGDRVFDGDEWYEELLADWRRKYVPNPPSAPQINALAPDSLRETDFERGYIKGVIEVRTDASKLAILLQMVLDDIKVCRSEHAENGTDWKPIDLSTETVEALDAAYAEALTRKPMPTDDGFRIRRDEHGEIVFVPTVEQAISDFAVAQNRMGQRLAYALRSINPTQCTEGIDLTDTDEGKACQRAYIALKAAIADPINAPAGTPALPSEDHHG